MNREVLKKEYKMNRKFKHQVVRNSFFNISTNIINKIGGVIFTILAARILQPTLFGVYTLTIAITGVFLVFADLGINSALIRYVSHAFEKSKAKASAYFQYLWKVKSFLILILASLMLILAKPLSEFIFHKPELFYPLLYSSIFLIFSSFSDFFSSMFFSLKRVKYVTFKELIIQIGRISLFVIFGFFLFKSFLVVSTILAWAIALLFASIFLLFILLRKYSFLFKKNLMPLNSLEKKALWSFIAVLAFAGVIGILNSSIDTILLGIFLKDTANIGFYRAALTIATSAASIIALSNVFLPIFTQLKSKKLSSAFEKLFDYCLILAFPISFGIALISKHIIGLIYGSSYGLASIPLTITSFAIIPITLSSIYTMLFYAKEKPLKPTILLTITTLINILLNLFLITWLLKQSEYLATIGAAIAITISNFFYLILISKLAQKQYNISINKKVIIKTLFSCIIMSIVLILLSLSWFKGISVLNLILQIIIGFAIYLILMLMMKGIKREDFELIKIIIKK